MNAWQAYYPRPQMRRESFLSLCTPGWTLEGQSIIVPFAAQSPQSGYEDPVGERLHYERRFTLPEGVRR